MLTPSQLLLLAQIGRYGSLAQAAEALGRTPSAVTSQLSKMEKGVGISLVLRGPRGARLTPVGASLARSGEVIAAEVANAEATVESLLVTLTSELRVGTFRAAGQHLLPPALTALRHRNKQVKLSVFEIASPNGAEMVARGELDIALIAGYEESFPAVAGVRAHHLLDDFTIFCLPSDHPAVAISAREGGLRLRDVKDEAWIAISSGHPARQQLDDAAESVGFTPNVVMETASYHVAQALVGTGIGIALLSRLTSYPTAGAIHVPLLEPPLKRTIFALTADENVSALAHNMLTLLRRNSKELQEKWLEQDPGVDFSEELGSIL
ncbi:LysR family transcriptional regulator [Arthrobacter nitrophenolicus]|uniref:LysR family transcriptional regulator n=1 Tax=Arthrobacter nitrophenolicus TaxID=683150 RepID=A0A4V3B273_9MICC|nr:LysR family transcriptional regulator [Arthrobacter nitrophenolicus]